MQRPPAKPAVAASPVAVTAAVAAAPVSRWNSPRVRAVVSLLVSVHLLAVLTGPFAQEPTSKLWGTLRGWFRPYHEACFFGHGYRFFNEPGPSHMVRYELEFADGRKETKQFPDRAEHWPRLWYHRHFMLAEHLDRIWIDPQQPPPKEISAEDRARWEMGVSLTQAYLKSYADHLLNARDAERITLYGLVRFRPSLAEVADRKARLDDPRFMPKPIFLGTFTRERP